MSSYRNADRDGVDLLNDVLHEHYAELVDAQVTVECLFAHAYRDPETGEKDGAAVVLHGWPCAARIKINSAENRAAGCSDARIVVDGDEWPEWSAARRAAVLDHEAYHLTLVRDRDGEIKSDDLGRPRLKLRPHDFEIGGFVEIAKRHGAESLEVQAVARAWKTLDQQEIDWAAAELAAAGENVLAGA